MSRWVHASVSALAATGLVAGGFWASRPIDSTAAGRAVPPASAPAASSPPAAQETPSASPSAAPSAPPATAQQSPATAQQLLATALEALRSANTGSVSWTTERKSSDTVAKVEFVGEYDLAAARWSGSATVDARRKGAEKNELRFRFVGSDSAVYASMDGYRRGERRWTPIEVGAGPVDGAEGAALLDALSAAAVTDVREGERRVLVGELPIAFVTKLLGLNVELGRDGVRPERLGGFARIEIGLSRDGAPRTVSVLGSTIESPDLPDTWRERAARVEFGARIGDLGRTKMIPGLPRAAELLPRVDSSGGGQGA
ncbi:MAG: hypothetical protein ACT4QF_08295 [Sporichthyaceae bacterium]